MAHVRTCNPAGGQCREVIRTEHFRRVDVCACTTYLYIVLVHSVHLRADDASRFFRRVLLAAGCVRIVMMNLAFLL